MIGYLEGVAKAPDLVLVGGVGYRVATPDPLADGERVTLHVETVIREDAFDLYGFATRAEAALFRALLRVNGVAARTAIAMLAGLGPARLARAVRAEDLATLTSVKGIGAKTAKTVCTSLTVSDDLLAALGADDEPADSCAPVAEDDVAAALVDLGYPAADVTAVLAAARAEQPGIDEQPLLALALRRLATGAVA